MSLIHTFFYTPYEILLLYFFISFWFRVEWMKQRLRSRVKWSRKRRIELCLLIIWIFVLLAFDYYFSLTNCKFLVGLQSLGDASPKATTDKNSKQENQTAILAASAETKRVDSLGPLIDADIVRDFTEKLRMFEENLKVVEGLGGNPEQQTKDFTDIIELPGLGVPLPYDMKHKEDSRHWEACDQRDADFTLERDKLCQVYLSNLNNVRYIKAMSSRLLSGRTIKFRLYYAHNGIEAIVKVSQRKFFFEASSEFLAFSIDRALSFFRVPTSVYLPLPIDYFRVATAYSPLFSQWLDRYLMQFNYTNQNFVQCDYPSEKKLNSSLCSYVTIQLWMHDVHSALSSFLEIPYDYNSAFAARYFMIGHPLWPPNPPFLRALGDLMDRFIFDFIIGNTDRGMNEHNNFVYGGCSYKTTCRRPPPAKRTKGLAKYAFIDHGSSFYSHREPRGNPFTGEIKEASICRFRKSTYDAMNKYRKTTRGIDPLVFHVYKGLSPAIFRVSRFSVIAKVQERMDKVLKIIDKCIASYGKESVFSLKEYSAVRIIEEESNYEEEN